jgi:adenylate kinase
MSPKTFLLIGRSGAGKGTQARLLNEYIKKLDADGHQLFYVETGTRFREFINKDGYTNSLAKEIANYGGRLPDFLAIWNWADLLIPALKQDMHLIMDGTPRSLPEAEILDTAFTFYNRLNPEIIYVNVSADWGRKRLAERHRIDDSTLADIENKVRWFDLEVVPAVNYFKNNPRYNFIEINGEQSIEKVQADILSAIDWTK